MSSADRKQGGAVGTRHPTGRRADKSEPAAEPELQVEELEERITPRLAANHNETLLVL